MIFFYSFIALFIAWIWVDYFRLIDVYEPENLKYFIITFLLGGASVYVVTGFQTFVFPFFDLEINGSIINDFLYALLKIGLIEELAKLIPFIIVYYLFRKQINEPIDYLAYMCISALGFSAVENLMYFNHYGGEIINYRAILASVGHMADSAFIAYGIILYKYHPKKYGKWIMILLFAIAALSHGIYDFFLLFNGLNNLGYILTIIYFLMLISVFATILNNALNNSSFFSYKKGIDSGFVSKRLLAYYGIVVLFQSTCVFIAKDFAAAFIDIQLTMFSAGIIILITCIRLSRFKHIEGHWEKIQLELPFSYGMPNASRGSLSIKGSSVDEQYINQYHKEYFIIKPLDGNSRIIKKYSLAYLEKFIFNEFENTCSLLKIYAGDAHSDYKYIVIKPKDYGTIYKGNYPIVSLNIINDISLIKDNILQSDNLKFAEWAYIKPLKNKYKEKFKVQ